MSEFDLIQRFFTRATPGAILGVGDDAALLHVAEGMELAVSTDMLVSGTHFLPDADPFLLGHKTLAVNLSDLAAMGAVPRWATLALSLPAADTDWLQRFSTGFFALADEHGVELVGGDTTRGPLCLSVTIMGEVPRGKALRRSGAEAGDDIWVSGMLGHAALGLAHLQGRTELPEDVRVCCLAALHQPQPRVALGLALRDIASSAIDISDGLLADLGHILERSHAGAEVKFDEIPTGIARAIDEPLFRHCVLSGGDDYELCFTACAAKRSEIEAVAKRLGLPLTRIGKIVTGQGCTVRSAKDGVMTIKESGYDHFA
ncbi:thiamine-phosphate kinase [Sideroxydans lithotrophicus]|uniref:Thiamine-monophosphate kinase n=1 Tax=Sideroxydans lithotrophicus (strain ES-1) TaxID=580332 RepID=D5CNI4_SIDLE|nr:thiamine-phosphate kinase [Sideroxydans lithotrophicus]ADE10897.1 thiamine-monophosphate kinase [Sideroxydans lithotrophicus ES-1]